MEKAFAVAVSQSDLAVLEKMKQAGLWIHADLEPLHGGAFIESFNSDLSIMWTFSSDLDVNAPGVDTWPPEDYQDQHIRAVELLLDTSPGAREWIRPEHAWEILLSAEDHDLLERIARRGWEVRLDLSDGISVVTQRGHCIVWSFISEVTMLNTRSDELLDSFDDVGLAIEALVALEKEEAV